MAPCLLQKNRIKLQSVQLIENTQTKYLMLGNDWQTNTNTKTLKQNNDI